MLVYPTLKIVGFGSHGHVQGSEDRGNDDSLFFHKVKSKSYLSKMKQNNYTKLLGRSFLKMHFKHGHPDFANLDSGFSPDRKSGFSPVSMRLANF